MRPRRSGTTGSSRTACCAACGREVERLSGRARAAAQAGRHSAPAAAAFTAFRLPSLLAKTALARNSPSDPLRGRHPPRGGRLSSVLKQGALDASLEAMRMLFWLRGSAPPMGPRTHRPGPLGSRPWSEGRCPAAVLAWHRGGTAPLASSRAP